MWLVRGCQAASLVLIAAFATNSLGRPAVTKMCNCEDEQTDLFFAADTLESAQYAFRVAAANYAACSGECGAEQDALLLADDIRMAAEDTFTSAQYALDECMYGGGPQSQAVEQFASNDGLHSVLVK
jgi:hypothetical protein